MMIPELKPQDWYLVLRDLSMDAVQAYLPAMGLQRPEDSLFASGLKPTLETYLRQPANQRSQEQLTSAILRDAEKKWGFEYPLRLRDWSIFIYPTQTSYRHEIFHWQIIVKRGAKNPSKDVQPVPQIIQRVRNVLAETGPIDTNRIVPTSEWDTVACQERHEEGIGCFEWVGAAVQNFRFLHAWVREAKSKEDVEQAYLWALSEAQFLKIQIKTLGRPEEFLNLPQSLRS